MLESVMLIHLGVIMLEENVPEHILTPTVKSSFTGT